MKFCLFYFLFISTLLSACQNRQKDKEAIRHMQLTNQLGDNLMIVYQDSKDNYWFGSWQTGLYLYNGKSVQHFTTKEGLTHNRIDEMKEDKNGNVFVTTSSPENTEGSIQMFDGKTFKNVPISKATRMEWKLAQGDLWFKARTNLGDVYRFDGDSLYPLKLPRSPNDKDDERTHPKHPWSPYDVYSLYIDHEGAIWFGTAEMGACRFDGKQHQWIYEDHHTNTPNGGSFGIRSILQDKAGAFWICNTRYRYKIQASLGSIKSENLQYQEVSGIEDYTNPYGSNAIYFMSSVEDNAGNLWILTYEQGVYKFDGDRVTHFPIQVDDKQIELYSIYQDKFGVLWLGSHKEGVFRFNGTTFKQFNL